jgi:YidC/Oxa1 family membrane protein insertase
MDRTAWIAVTFCVVGLVVWQIYLVKQTPPRPAPVNVAPEQASPTAAIASPTPLAASAAAPRAAEPVPSFPEKIETLRNSDVELRLTNRGGGIKEAILLRQVAEKGEPVS